MDKTVNEMLKPSNLPLLVKPDGTYEVAKYPPATLAEYAPESITLDWSGEWGMPDVLEEHERAAIASVENGWEVLTGWAGPGTLFIFDSGRTWLGGDLEEHIRDTPGLWSCVSVEMYPPTCDDEPDGMPCEEYNTEGRCDHADYPAESQAAGWALVHREIPAAGK